MQWPDSSIRGKYQPRYRDSGPLGGAVFGAGMRFLDDFMVLLVRFTGDGRASTGAQLDILSRSVSFEPLPHPIPAKVESGGLMRFPARRAPETTDN